MKRWLFTAFSFAVVLGVSWHAVRSSAENGLRLAMPPLAHLLAALGFATEVASRAFKLTWSARAVGTRMTFMTAVRTSLGGDFGASITPARMGAEPARYLILAESGMGASDAMVVLYTELFLEAISLAMIAGLMLLLFNAPAAFTVVLGTIVGVYAATILTVGLFGSWLARRRPGETPPSWALRIGLAGSRWAFVLRWVDRLRVTVDAFRRMRRGWAMAALLASLVHVGVRFSILPVLVLTMTAGSVAIDPLVLWPFMLIYGAAVVPAPGGGGAVELAFRAALGRAIPATAFAASLVWWRFYTFYLYIALGALVAGNTALRAIREAEDVEQELERA